MLSIGSITEESGEIDCFEAKKRRNYKITAAQNGSQRLPELAEAQLVTILACDNIKKPIAYRWRQVGLIYIEAAACKLRR